MSLACRSSSIVRVPQRAVAGVPLRRPSRSLVLPVKAVGKADLVNAISERTGLKKKDVESVVNGVFDVIIENVAADQRVLINGFGTFERKTRKARNGRNPQTGAAMQIPEKKVPAFSAAKNFKDKTAGGAAPTVAPAKAESSSK